MAEQKKNTENPTQEVVTQMRLEGCFRSLLGERCGWEGWQQVLLLPPLPVGASRAARGAAGKTGTAKAAPPAPRQRQGKTCSPRAAPQAQPLGSEAGQESAARVPTEPALPGCGLASTMVRWSKDPAGSTAREGDAQGAPTHSQAAVP